jgi:membrane-anchored glycerophosphoryl diester phosphodiesterase (GDPDase)
VTDPERLDLAKQRGVSELLGDALRIYRAHFWKLFPIALAIVVPVELIVSGIGMEQLTAGFQEESSTSEFLIPAVVGFLITAPLVTAATIGVLQALSNAAKPRFRQSIQLALDVFPHLFLASLLAGLAIGSGLLLLVVPGIYLAVRLLFVTQSVVVDGKHGPDALRASWALTAGRWWRVFLVALAANLAALIPSLLLGAPFELLADSADRQAFALLGMILAEALAVPFLAIVSTLLFFGLRADGRPGGDRQVG